MAQLDRLLAARSVAVVGASARPGSFGERLAIEALRSQVDRVDLVHPRYSEVQGHPCAPSLEALDHTPDLVLLGVPDAVVPDQLALASGVGAGGAVVYGSAVGLGAAIRSAAGDLVVCGAGCMGFVNVTGGLRALGYLERSELEPGGIALVTHSGSVFSALLRTHRRLEYALAVSSGQELVTTTGEYLDWALDQPETRVVGLFLETIRKPLALRAALARAAERDVPVVALTVGGSPAGRAMVTAHSGAIAGEDAAWEALFDTYGVHRARDMEELVDSLELFAIGRRVRTRSTNPPGLRRGIATVHDSGAERVLTADVASAEGVPFAELGTATKGRIDPLLDKGLVVGNPLDVWGRGTDTETLFAECLSALAEDPAVDVVALAIDLVEEYDGDESYPRAVTKVAAATDKPVVVVSHVPAAVDQTRAAALRAAGIPVLEGVRSGLRALSHLLAHGDVGPAGDATTAASAQHQAPTDPAPDPGWLDAVESLQLLARHGFRVTPTRACGDEEAAVTAADELGYPVVLKTDEPGIEHRARVGGVLLGLTDEAAVRSAYRLLVERCGPRVAVQHQVAGPTEAALGEVAVGVVVDPAVGPILLLALGGGRIEELATRALALPPLNRPAADDVVDRLLARAGGVLPTDVATRGGLVDTLLALSDLVEAEGEDLAALDVNPLLLTPDGPVAVDALVQRRRGTGPAA